MMLITKEIMKQLEINGLKQDEVRGTDGEFDFEPVVKLFMPDGGAIWLLTEIEPDDPDIAFGLCDLGVGCPELGSVRLSEITSIRGVLGLPVERDRYFTADKTLMGYASEAWKAERIIA